MHIAHLWSIIENHPQCNFLEGSVDKSKAKKIVTRLILNTDMSFHNKNLSSFHEAWNTKQINPKQNSEHKWVLPLLFRFLWSKYSTPAISATAALSFRTT